MSSDALRRAVETMAEVHDACVWSQQMTHESLLPFLIEEAHELIDAVERGTMADVREELGDVLWQVLFQSELASRAGAFTIDDVADGLVDKIVRRHPHVYAGKTATTPEEVVVLWNEAKAREKSTRTSVLDGVARSMPALAYAQKIIGKAAQVGIVPASPAAEGDTDDDLGAALLALVVSARERGLDAETLLRAQVNELERAVREKEHPSG